MQGLVIYIVLLWLVSGGSETTSTVNSTRRFASYLKGSYSLHIRCARKITSGNVIVQWDFSLTHELCLSYIIYILDTHTHESYTYSVEEHQRNSFASPNLV